jgi:hypothetical protein
MTDIGDDRLQRLVSEAHHESVTPDILTETKANFGSPRLSDRPLITYLRSNEQPHFVFHAKKETPEWFGVGAPDEELSRSRGHIVLHLITDQRWIMVAGNRKGDQTNVIPLERIAAVDYSTEGAIEHSIAERIPNNTVVLDTDDAFFEIPIARDFDVDDFEELCSYLRDVANAIVGGVALDPDEAGYTVDRYDNYEPDRETVARLLDDIPSELQSEADQVIRDAENTQALVTQLNELLAEHEREKESLDDVVADAGSTEELREAVKTPTQQRLDSIREGAMRGVSEAKRVAGNADPEEVGRWALGVGQATAPLARRAPLPTYLLMGATLVTGGATGAYQSSSESSILDDIDPLELAGHASAMANRGQELDNIDGEAVGALLGATSYFGDVLAPDEYARWITEADFDAILEGAERGAARAKETGQSPRQGAMVGAGLGLSYGYANNGGQSPEDAMREALDEDQYKEYLEELAKRGLLHE